MGSNIEKVKPYVKEWKYQILPHTKHTDTTTDLQVNPEYIRFLLEE